MKIIFAWKRNGVMQEYTNADPHDHLMMSLLCVNDAIKRVVEKEGISAQEAVEQMLEKIEKEGEK